MSRPRTRWIAIAAVATAIVWAAPDPAAQPAVTLEALLAAPFPSELVASATGGHVAWAQNTKGARNVWLASAPDFAARPLTGYSGDDGQDITSLTWAPDGRAVIFIRGGAPNRQGEVPNPALTPQPAEQGIWAVDVQASSTSAPATPRKLATGSSPAVSRTGQVAYLSKGQIWITSLAGFEKPAQLLTIRGTARDLRWSPDGNSLTFISARGDHSFVGLYDVAAKTLRYLDPGIDQDGNPSWSPEGTRLAFTRIPSTGETFMFGPRREGQPWSIRVVDVASGKGTEVWKAPKGRGSVFQGVAASDQLLWADGDRIVFPSEQEGWIHLYSVSAGGGAATPLTPGSFEVEHVVLSRDRRQVVYSSNQDDIDRRHIWSVPVGGTSRPAAVTRGSGAEWMPAPLDAGVVAVLQSDGRRPARPAVVRDRTMRALDGAAPGGTTFSVDQLVEPQRVTFRAADGMEIAGQLFVPRDLKSGDKRPAVIFFHGGSRRQMLLAWHYLSYYHNTYSMNQYLAGRGYVVLSVNYRSGTGYGLEFREALNYGATGASEFNDVVGAGLYMRSRSDVDPNRIGVYGGSYGGFLTAHALARASDLFAAGVDIHGVHDWNVGIRTFVPSYNPAPEIERRNFESSPLHFVKGWRSPVLLVHGDDDRNVSFSETIALAEALRKQGVPFETLVLPDEIHGFLRYDSWLRVFKASADFLDRQLKDRKPAGTR